jgi:outer membrane protein
LLDAENNLKITYINMNLMLGLPEGTELIADSTAFQNLDDAGIISTWEESAFQNRKDMAALSSRGKAANMSIKAAKGEYFPGLALSGGYVALDVPNVLTVTNAFDGGIGLQYNLSSLWKTGAKVAEARALYEEVEANKDILSDQIRIQVNQAYENYLSSRKKIDVYANAVEQATENYRIVKNKQINNLATTTDLLDADVAQLQARLNYAFAKSDAVVAYKKLQQAAGSLR